MALDMASVAYYLGGSIVDVLDTFVRKAFRSWPSTSSRFLMPSRDFLFYSDISRRDRYISE
jgi:hypothetical protein